MHGQNHIKFVFMEVVERVERGLELIVLLYNAEPSDSGNSKPLFLTDNRLQVFCQRHVAMDVQSGYPVLTSRVGWHL
jgi:hypothetical protein